MQTFAFHFLVLTHFVQFSWQSYTPYKHYTSSLDARPALQNKITNPLLARLYAAKRAALQTANSIDSMITEAIQKERFQHEYASSELPVTATFPYIESDVVGGPKSVAANIGAHGGKWYYGTLGGSAGQVSAGMVNTGTRRNQAYFSPIPQRNVPPAQISAYAPHFERLSPVVTNFIGAQRNVEPLVNQLKVSSQSTRASMQASADKLVRLPKAKPTKDPVEDMPSLGNPEAFENRCTVLKLTFEHFKNGQVLDDSFQKNNVRLSSGVTVTNRNIMSGHSVHFGKKGNIVLARDFKGKPRKAVGISMWVKLDDVKGNYSLLRAMDGTDNATHYNLGVHDGKGLWVHYDDAGKELFRVESESSDIRAGKWHNIVANYNSLEKKATLWVDGRLVSQKNGMSGPLSQKWSKVVVFGGKTAGLLDNVFMFRCPLDRTKIVALYVAAATPSAADKKSQIQKQQVTNKEM